MESSTCTSTVHANDTVRQIDWTIRGSLRLNLENNLKDYIVIWVDQHIETSADCSQTLEDLHVIAGCVEPFTNVTRCMEFIESTKEAMLFVMLSAQLAHVHIHDFEQYEQVQCIYVFCSKEQIIHTNSSKMRGVFTSKLELLRRLSADIKSFADRWSFIGENSYQGFEGKDECTSHWYQFLLLVTTTLKATHHDYETMLAECRSYYRRYPAMLRKIDEFETNYTSKQAVHYYTKQSFIYAIVNRALRTQNPEIIVKFRSFIADLHGQLSELFQIFLRDLETSSARSPLFWGKLVYRGQYLSIDELENLRERTGEYIIMNTFCSGTEDKAVALQYIGEGQGYSSDIIPTLFQIVIAKSFFNYLSEDAHQCKPFASVSSSSQFENEREILFSPGTICRLSCIQLPSSDRPWAVVELAIDDFTDFSLIESQFIMTRVKSGESLSSMQLLTVLNFAHETRQINNWRSWCSQCWKMQMERPFFWSFPLVALMLDYIASGYTNYDKEKLETIYRKSAQIQIDLLAPTSEQRLRAMTLIMEQALCFDTHRFLKLTTILQVLIAAFDNVLVHVYSEPNVNSGYSIKLDDATVGSSAEFQALLVIIGKAYEYIQNHGRAVRYYEFALEIPNNTVTLKQLLEIRTRLHSTIFAWISGNDQEEADRSTLLLKTARIAKAHKHLVQNLEEIRRLNQLIQITGDR